MSRFKFSANRIIFTGFFEKSVLYESAFNRSLMFFKEWLKVFNAAGLDCIKLQKTAEILKRRDAVCRWSGIIG